MTFVHEPTTRTAARASSADVLLADGSVASIRPMAAEDRQLVESLFGASSERSLYSRFFTLGSAAVSRYVSHLFEPISSTSSLVVEQNGTIIGIVDAERCGPTEADIAFLVADDAQGRGVATVLLEHQAARSRQEGVLWFTAEILATNLAMLGVFRDAGFAVTQRMEAGIVALTMSTATSPESIATADVREIAAQRNSLNPLLHPHTVAVVGIRRTASGVGRAILKSITDGGFSGDLYAVHPMPIPVAGVPVCSSLATIPGRVDLAIIAVPAHKVMSVMHDAAQAGVRAVVVVSSGFGEIGSSGLIMEQDLVRFARRHNIRMVGPNCLGIVCNDTSARLNATFGCALPRVGGLAIASQSGGVAIALLQAAADAELGVASFVSLGNKADVSGNDLIEAWIDDPSVDVAALYLESFGNPLKFARLARRFCERKPLLALVGGRSVGGQRADASHTAASASPVASVNAMFSQAGVIGCQSLEELLDTARLMKVGALPAGRRLGIISNAGGLGVLAADAAADAGILVPELSSVLRQKVAGGRSSTVGSGNPIDMGAATTPDRLRACSETLLGSHEVDALLVVVSHTARHGTASLIEPIARLAEMSPDKPVLVVASGAGDRVIRHYGPTVFESAGRALKALAHACDYAEWRQTCHMRLDSSAGPAAPAARTIAVNILASRPSSDEGVWLSVPESKKLLGLYGIDAPIGEVTSTFAGALAAATHQGLPATMKCADPRFVHKSELRLVITGLSTMREVHDAVKKLRIRTGDPKTPILVQPFVDGGVEVAVGLIRDPRFGPLVMVAAGGTATEILDDRAFLTPPFSELDVQVALHALRIWPLLNGYRGDDPVSTDGLTTLIQQIGHLSMDVPELSELDLNPVIVTPAGIRCVDARIRVAQSQLQLEGFSGARQLSMTT